MEINKKLHQLMKILNCLIVIDSSYRMTKLMSNLNLMTTAKTMKMKKQQILLLIMKKNQRANETSQTPVILVDLSEENTDLKNDTMFLDSYGRLLSSPQTSHH